VGKGDAGLRWRRKNTNTPKAANPTTAPLTLPAIAPTFLFLAGVGGLVGLGVIVGIVVKFMLDVVEVGELVDNGGLVDSGPPVSCFKKVNE